jgi:hypothetical protein
MTALEALESFSADRNESFNEILEWPYRRYVKAFSSWQRRKIIEEIENRKIAHMGALMSIIEWKQPEDQEKAIESTEEYYEKMKDIIWDPLKNQKENDEMKALEDSDPFIKAGRKSIRKIIPVEAPGQLDIEKQIS